MICMLSEIHTEAYFTSKIYKSKTILKMPCKLSLTICQLQRLEVWRGYWLSTGELLWMIRCENRVTEQTWREFQAPDKIQSNTTSLDLCSLHLKFTSSHLKLSLVNPMKNNNITYTIRYCVCDTEKTYIEDLFHWKNVIKTEKHQMGSGGTRL